ncbi:membrane protein DedA, SNARE-associated domain [Oceanobacillus limi]|uniref:Membrane protein DedA, SNARE-associated domain n=1 Tax=Oceanobacillus limi TaxID=930131 RepID=A0A1I0A669_9BACI|nr:VTT domain-containing protein [Oceanobacillus limi]SES89614.1 membrane protein DedA, SNARE-associated domain [Oceanobacillus limi]
MFHRFLEWLQAIGEPGLYFVMLLEGSSFPFPGVILVLSFGYILSPGYGAAFLLAAKMSLCYSLASLLPYFLARNLKKITSNRLKKGLNKAESLFNRYGIWSIAFSRPFGIGNYISYVAGYSKVNVSHFLILTCIGIYPWCYALIMLGNYFNGSYEAFRQLYDSYSVYIYGAVAIIIIGIILLWIWKRKRGDGSSASKTT